ncbi:MAG: sugar phosphate isomerase/epimerase [Sedimentisphaerales bacterium]|nr:sugar phosphate isomerase/epimerase [Sedimentisphaerales bacterium]
MKNSSFYRRDFIKTAGVLAAVTSSGLAPSLFAVESKERSGPKIGCTSWCFHSFAAGTNPEEAIELIGRIGFDGIELILLGRDDITNYWTGPTINRIQKQLDRWKLQVSQFVLFQPVVEGLSSLNPDERKRNLDYFETGCKIGRKFNAPVVNIVAPWPRELGQGQGYIPRYYEMPNPQPDQKYHINMTADFDWDRIWAQYIDTTKACLERAKAQKMKMSIEHHTHTIIPDTTAFLRLWDAIRDPALGLNLDVGWTLLQREYPPVAVHKAGPRLMNLHMRDIDGAMRQFVHIGHGVMDFKAICDSLKAIQFEGFLSIEQDKYPGDMEETCIRYLAMMKEYLA